MPAVRQSQRWYTASVRVSMGKFICNHQEDKAAGIVICVVFRPMNAACLFQATGMRVPPTHASICSAMAGKLILYTRLHQGNLSKTLALHQGPFTCVHPGNQIRCSSLCHGQRDKMWPAIDRGIEQWQCCSPTSVSKRHNPFARWPHGQRTIQPPYTTPTQDVCTYQKEWLIVGNDFHILKFDCYFPPKTQGHWPRNVPSVWALFGTRFQNMSCIRSPGLVARVGLGAVPGPGRSGSLWLPCC